MSSSRFIIADVFTEKRFGGNQLAVFPDGSGLDAAAMQDIAREMHFSETTFLFPPEAGGDYRIRIFTPEHELPFAGHPIVGTAHVIVAEGIKRANEPLTSVVLETGVGPISVEVSVVGGRAGHTTMTQPLPVVKTTFTDIERLARALALRVADIRQTELPVEAIYNGITVLIVPVTSLDAVQRVKVDTGALEAISREVGAETVLVFTRETLRPDSAAHCRVFAPAAGVIEDAATGSANGPFGFYLVRHKLVEAEKIARIISEQGFEMNRPSLLHIEITADPVTRAVERVRVGGGVVIAGRGEILLS
ncbi:MAG TPA: PhzF family phenazine biosynthesis protein [Blastocatellia bacterium]|nr:PhzF family phenazine biosynthesis protein [Blastocatellia bacterium]